MGSTTNFRILDCRLEITHNSHAGKSTAARFLSTQEASVTHSCSQRSGPATEMVSLCQLRLPAEVGIGGLGDRCGGV